MINPQNYQQQMPFGAAASALPQGANTYPLPLPQADIMQQMLMSGVLSQMQNPAQPGKAAQNKNQCCPLNLEEHLMYIDALVQAKLIDNTTGQLIKEQMTAAIPAKGNASKGDASNGANVQHQDAPRPESAEDDFLLKRECLREYLNSAGVELDGEDLEKIKAVVNALENQAIERKTGISASLNKTNEKAKERLKTGSMAKTGSQNPGGRYFTREEIGKMSSEEFIKNEPMINYQLENGLL